MRTRLITDADIEREFASLGDDRPPRPPKCEGCGAVIDPKWCWCGDAISRHMGYDGHSPVPMGCVCHLKFSAEPEGGSRT